MKITSKLISRLVREEVQAIYREGDDEVPAEDQEGSKDEVGAAKEQDMKSDVVRVAKFMFKNKQLGPALEKIKGNVEAAQLLGLLAQELKVEPGDISNVMAKVKKGIGDAADAAEEAPAAPAQQGGDEELAEAGRYHRSPYQGDDPRAQAFDQAINIIDDQVYDSLEDDVSSYADDAVRALSKAIEELEYKRNQVGNVNEKRK